MPITRHPSLLLQILFFLQFFAIDLVTDFRKLVEKVQNLDHIVLISNPDVDEFLAKVAKVIFGVNHAQSSLA